MTDKYLTIQEAVKLTKDLNNIRDIEVENEFAFAGTIPFYLSETFRFCDIDNIKIKFKPLSKQIEEAEEMLSNCMFQVEMLRNKIAKLKEIKE